MKKNILLVYPEIPVTYWSLSYMLPFLGKEAVLPPLGLMTVAALIPDGYGIKLVDMNVSPLREKDLLEADLVFISAMIIQKISFEQVVRLCRKLGKTIVAGGPYPISLHESIKDIDHFVLDEAEVTLPEFFRDYEKGVPRHLYRSEIKPDISETPPPRFDIIDIKSYLTMALQFSRGCPYNCEFCDIIEMFGRRPRTKSPDQFIHEMDLVYETGFRGSVFIVDDNFIGNKKKVKVLLRRIVQWQKQRGYPFQFVTEASIDVAYDDELLELMRQCSFDFIFIGIESPDVDTLKAANKIHNTRMDLEEAVKNIYRFRIAVAGGFIVGFDTDGEDIFDRQISFIQEAAIPMAMIGILTAMPHTQLHRRLEKEGRLLGDWSGNNTHDLEVNFTPRMPVDTLVGGYKKVISTIYDPKIFFDRCLAFLKCIPEERIGARPVHALEILAFIKSVLIQTFSSYGLRYLEFVWKGLRINRKFMPEIITFAIHGHHFIRLTREILEAGRPQGSEDPDSSR